MHIDTQGSTVFPYSYKSGQNEEISSFPMYDSGEKRMARISISVKYSFLVFFSIVATSVLLSWFVLDIISTQINKQLVLRGQTITQQLSYALAPLLLSRDHAKVKAALNKLFEKSDIVDATIIDSNEKIIVADKDYSKIGQPFENSKIDWEKRGCQGLIEDKASDRLIFLSSASFSNVKVGCVIVQISTLDITKTIHKATLRVLYVTVLIALVIIALSFIMLRRALKPLSKVIDGTRKIADGHFSTRIGLRTRDEIGELAEAFDAMAARTELFFRYVDKSIAERLVKNGDLARPGGKLKQVSVLFGDMRGFTQLSNELTPGEVVWILNTYFSLFFQVVHHFDGVVDKTMGDAIMAFYEPYTSKDISNAKRAIMSAIAMRASVWILSSSINEVMKLKAPLRIPPCNFGFAVATGRLIVGNIGSVYHLDYTVCGPAVNLASRLQQDTRKGEIIMDRFTAMDVDNLVDTKQLPQVLPKGFLPSHEVTPYLVVSLKEKQRKEIGNLLAKMFTRDFFMNQVLADKVGQKQISLDHRLRWANAMLDKAKKIFESSSTDYIIT